MNITSNATWTMIPKSSDNHDTIEQAQCVCNRLIDYRGLNKCKIRGECVDAWVEINGVRVMEEKRIKCLHIKGILGYKTITELEWDDTVDTHTKQTNFYFKNIDTALRFNMREP